MNNPQQKRGVFISFEGLDYSGKSTQIALLTHRLEQAGYPLILIREPGGTPISERIREILLDRQHDEMTDICELLLYSAARHQLVTQKILTTLNAGTTVIADRFVDSTTAYQGYGRQLPMKFIRQLNQIATGGLMPAVTFFLDLNYEHMQDRMQQRQISADRLESQGRIFYERVRNGYLEIAENNSERFKIVDAAASVDHISAQIWEFVAAVLPLKL